MSQIAALDGVFLPMSLKKLHRCFVIKGENRSFLIDIL